MEQKFSNNSLDLQVLREFCEREGEAVVYRKGDQMEREGDPARWFAFVESGCFKYVNHSSDGREHLTWFSFEGEYVVDYPTFLYGRPSQTTIMANILVGSPVRSTPPEEIPDYDDWMGARRNKNVWDNEDDWEDE